ncbi:unnamed protein product [Orchesella dallaii]|uniref:Uncharacterized protein n=1 Tax=Orchesella dallaii TaxID=48710 RepID=A0ABP1S480_9HEXA
MKIDNHCHCAGCAVASILLKHIQAKFDNYPGIIWINQLGEAFTIKDIFAQIGVTDSEKITEKLLDIKADETCWRNFPNFRLKFIPCGLPTLRDAFLRTDNMNGGEWYGDIIKEVYFNVKATGCQGVELRITIHGRYLYEWVELAKCDESFKKASGRNTDVDSYGSYLRNVFAPLFENSAKDLSKMTPDEVVLSDCLARVKGFDSVGEEEVNETFVGEWEDPDDWITNKKPPYHYELFHLFSNMAKLNSLRRYH